MNSKYISVSLAAAAILLCATLASAQVIAANPSSNQVNVTSTPSSNGVTPGQSGTTFGTVSVSGNGGGTYSLTSLPITVTPGVGGSSSSLSNCQLFNSNGAALNTNGNVVNTLASSGSSTFTFDNPLQINGSTTTLTVKCNVAASATSGSTYQFVAGNPSYAAGLGVMVTTSGSIPAGEQMAPLALITLDGTRSGMNTNVTSIPVTLTFNGAASSEFTNCGLENVNSLGTPLNTGTNAVGTFTNGTSNTITLNAPVSVPAGGIQVLALTCNIDSVTPVGASVVVSVDPAAIPTTNASSGAVVTPAAGITASGGTAPTYGTVLITAPGSTTTTIPGAPNTGAGGEAPINYAILAISGAILLFAVAKSTVLRKS